MVAVAEDAHDGVPATGLVALEDWWSHALTPSRPFRSP